QTLVIYARSFHCGRQSVGIWISNDRGSVLEFTRFYKSAASGMLTARSDATILTEQAAQVCSRFDFLPIAFCRCLGFHLMMIAKDNLISFRFQFLHCLDSAHGLGSIYK